MTRPTITRARPYTPSRGRLVGRTFTSERQYRNALAQRKGYPSFSAQQRAPRTIKRAAGLLGLTPREADDRTRAINALADMRRHGLSLREAARRNGIPAYKVQRYAGDALERTAGRWTATPRDRLARSVRMIAVVPTEPIALTVTDSATASKIGRHTEAVKHYLRTGDASRLRPFRGQYVQVGKLRYAFLTDPTEIERRKRLGALSFESLYVLAA
jgi:hypothetical protein